MNAPNPFTPAVCAMCDCPTGTNQVCSGYGTAPVCTPCSVANCAVCSSPTVCATCNAGFTIGVGGTACHPCNCGLGYYVQGGCDGTSMTFTANSMTCAACSCMAPTQQTAVCSGTSYQMADNVCTLPDLCSPSPCAPLSQCTLSANRLSYTCGPCPRGFRGTGYTLCINIGHDCTCDSDCYPQASSFCHHESDHHDDEGHGEHDGRDHRRGRCPNGERPVTVGVCAVNECVSAPADVCGVGEICVPTGNFEHRCRPI